MNVRWRVRLTEEGRQQLAAITDRRVQAGLKKTLKRLEHEPDKQGKQLSRDLAGLRSVRAVGQRYRIIYRVEGDTVTVYVIALGIRREGDKTDIYALTSKLLRARMQVQAAKEAKDQGE